MSHRFAELTQTPSVRTVQDRQGVRDRNARREALGGPNDTLGSREAEFIDSRDSFFIASVSESGWPYVQHRGGLPGFVRVADGQTIVFGDYRGNRQYLSVGNLEHEGRVALIFVDYPHQRRLKILGHARIHGWGEVPSRLKGLLAEAQDVVIEHVMEIRVEAFDWNCSMHITPRYTADEVMAVTQALRDRIEALEAQLQDPS